MITPWRGGRALESLGKGRAGGCCNVAGGQCREGRGVVILVRRGVPARRPCCNREAPFVQGLQLRS